MNIRRPDSSHRGGRKRARLLLWFALATLGVLLVLGATTVLHGLPNRPQAARPSSSSSPRAAEPYRPAFHITPAAQWMNDPQRPFFLDGLWHFYYLYNKDYPDGNGTEWRHLTSPDLVHWSDRGTAIEKYANGLGDIETGSTVIDRDGTAGHGRNAVIAILTQQSDGVQRQSMFYSTDGGYHFASDAANPVMQNPGVKDWRDPKVVWDAAHDRWVLVLAEGQKLGIYTSPDLRRWTYESGVQTADIGTVECPDLFQLDVNGDPAEPVWVLAASANRATSAGTTGFAYWTGRFDGTHFTPDTAKPQWLDQGPDFYAAVTWPAAGSTSTRYALAWMNNWSYAEALPTTSWHGGADTIPRELRLQQVGGEPPRLVSAPVTAAVPARAPSRSLAPGRTNRLPASLDGAFTLELDGSESPAAGSTTRVRLTGAAGAHVDISYDPTSGRLTVDRHADSFGRTPAANDTYRAPTSMTVPPGQARFEVVVDRSSIEVFAADGESLTAQMFLRDGVATITQTGAHAPLRLRAVAPVPVHVR